MIVTYSRLVTVALILAALAAGVQTCRIADRDAALAVASLPAGFVGSTDSSPTVPGVVNRYVVATVQGGVRYLPAPSVAGPGPNVTPQSPPAASSPGPCDLDAIAVDIRCRAEVVEGAARLFVSGRLELSGDSRELPERIVGEPVPGVETAPPVVAVRRLEWPRNELRAGAWSDGYLSAGYTRWFTRHVGAWGEYRHPLDPQDARAVGGGVAVRF